jgi:predicted transposase/invertase (TIGR01784 family)
MNFSKEEREAYEDRLKWFRIEANTLKKMREDSLAEGVEIGKAEGKAEEKMEIAINLLKSGLSIDVISAATGLTLEQIEKIKSS